MHDTIPRPREYLLLIVSGVALVFAFPPFDVVPVAFVALVAEVALVEGKYSQGFPE